MTSDSKFRTPGQLLENLLEERGWTQNVLAIILDVDRTGINKIVGGSRPVTAELAIALGEVFEINPERFMELQKSYDLAKARIVVRPDPGRANRAHLFGELPISEMIKRSWINAKDVNDVSNVESALADFFGVDTPEEIEFLPHAAKKTTVSTSATPAQLAWLYRVKAIASEMLVAPYSKSSVRGGVRKLKELLFAAEEARKVPRIMAESGIRFVIVESLPGANIDGVCFWLDEKSPVIGMSLRYDRIDNFWFVLRHELEHVIRRHGDGTTMLDADLEGDRAGTGPSVAEEERIANEAAAQFCVPKNKMDNLIARKAPLFMTRDVLGFARTLKIHPGLVAGQLQYRTGRYNLLRDHLVKIRHIVAPSAIVDGWGDISPLGNLGG